MKNIGCVPVGNSFRLFCMQSNFPIRSVDVLFIFSSQEFRNLHTDVAKVLHMQHCNSHTGPRYESTLRAILSKQNRERFANKQHGFYGTDTDGAKLVSRPMHNIFNCEST